MKTKYGNAVINHGYYRITSGKEGNHGKPLHRLIYEDYYKVSLLEETDIHHIDGDKLNNNISNLIPMKHNDHCSMHMKGRKNAKGCKRSEETRKKISETKKGVPHSETNKRNMSIAKNTSGIRNVYKIKDKKRKQGFAWEYSFYEDGKRKKIARANIDDLKSAVIERGLIWEKL